MKTNEIAQAEQAAYMSAAVVATATKLTSDIVRSIISAVVDDDDGQASARDLAVMAARRIGMQPNEAMIAAIVAVIAAQEAVNAARTTAAVAAMAPVVKTRAEILDAEWEAAWAAAPRHQVEVYDEDGGSSLEIKIVSGWTHKGFYQFEYCRFLNSDEEYRQEEAVKNRPFQIAAKEFVASMATMRADEAKKAYQSLAPAVQTFICQLLPRHQRKVLL
jgi:hypothetical protein